MTSLRKIELRLGEEVAFAIFLLPATQMLRRDLSSSDYSESVDLCAPAHFDLSVWPIYVARVPAAPFASGWRDLPSSDYGMASKMARQEEEGKRKVGSKN